MGWFGRSKRGERGGASSDPSAAFVERVFVHWEALYRFALRLTGDEHEAEDVVQESLTKALAAFERLRDDTNHRAWIYTIVRNTFLSRVRKSGREQVLEDPVAVVDERAPGPDDALVRPDDGWREGFEDEVLAALQELPEAQRSALVLCDIEGLSYDEISHVLGCPIGTVRSRIHHARRRLRALLAGYANARGYTDVQHAR